MRLKKEGEDLFILNLIFLLKLKKKGGRIEMNAFDCISVCFFHYSLSVASIASPCSCSQSFVTFEHQKPKYFISRMDGW